MTLNSTFDGVETLHLRWGWLLALGIVMIVLGTVAIYVSPAATLGTVLVLGRLLILSGVAESIFAFRERGWGGFFLHLIGGALGVLIGLLVITHPVAGALAWTLLFASFFTVMGIVRMVAAISLKFPNWGWTVLDSAITLGLGIMLWAEWPSSGLWFLGMAVGVSLVLRGWAYVMFATAIRKFPVTAEVRPAA